MTTKDNALRQAREALLKARWETQARSEVDLEAESAIASIDAALSEKAEAVACPDGSACAHGAWCTEAYCQKLAQFRPTQQLEAQAEPSQAYDLIDRFLRNNLDDTDYAEYSAALDKVLAAQQPAPQPLERTALEQYDLEQSSDYRKGWDDGRAKGFEVGYRHATEHAELKAAPQPADERGAFEAWAEEEGYPLGWTVDGPYNRAGYRNMATHQAWEGWQARAALKSANGGGV